MVEGERDLGWSPQLQKFTKSKEGFYGDLIIYSFAHKLGNRFPVDLDGLPGEASAGRVPREEKSWLVFNSLAVVSPKVGEILK